MRKMRKVHWSRQVLMGVLSLVMALAIAVTVDALSIVSHAQSQGRVTTGSANIRETTSTSGAIVASVVQNDELTINGQTTGSDGYTWYQVYVDANTLGYIRSDLVEITSGGTPPTLSNTPAPTTNTANTNTPAATYNPTVEVTEVNPVSATVTGGQEVRVRADASTSSGIITTAKNGTALTVTGQANGTDNNVWYRVNFTVNGSEVTGFIRSDYVKLSEEVTPVTDTPEPEHTEQPETEPVVQTKDWETQFEGEAWYLINNVTPERWKIDDIFYAANHNKDLAEEEAATIRNQKIVIILLVVVILILVVALTMAIFKMKDMSDSTYFKEVERETLKRKGSSKAQGSGQRSSRPQSQGDKRLSGARAAQGSRSASDGRRPAQGGARPAQSTQGSRPTQASRTVQSPNAGRPTEGVRSTQSAQGEGRPAQSQGVERQMREEARPASEQPREERKPQQKPSSESTKKQAWKSKNFMADDEDEFEFEYLNWDGDEEP